MYDRTSSSLSEWGASHSPPLRPILSFSDSPSPLVSLSSLPIPPSPRPHTHTQSQVTETHEHSEAQVRHSPRMADLLGSPVRACGAAVERRHAAGARPEPSPAPASAVGSPVCAASSPAERRHITGGATACARPDPSLPIHANGSPLFASEDAYGGATLSGTPKLANGRFVNGAGGGFTGERGDMNGLAVGGVSKGVVAGGHTTFSPLSSPSPKSSKSPVRPRHHRKGEPRSAFFAAPSLARALWVLFRPRPLGLLLLSLLLGTKFVFEFTLKGIQAPMETRTEDPFSGNQFAASVERAPPECRHNQGHTLRRTQGRTSGAAALGVGLGKAQGDHGKAFAWVPREQRFLLLYCVLGQVSNRMKCMDNHVIAAALLNRTLVVPAVLPRKLPRSKWKQIKGPQDPPYVTSVVWNVSASRQCFGGDTGRDRILQDWEFERKFTQPVVVDRVHCWHGPRPACPGRIRRALSHNCPALAAHRGKGPGSIPTLKLDPYHLPASSYFAHFFYPRGAPVASYRDDASEGEEEGGEAGTGGEQEEEEEEGGTVRRGGQEEYGSGSSERGGSMRRLRRRLQSQAGRRKTGGYAEGDGADEHEVRRMRTGAGAGAGAVGGTGAGALRVTAACLPETVPVGKFLSEFGGIQDSMLVIGDLVNVRLVAGTPTENPPGAVAGARGSGEARSALAAGEEGPVIQDAREELVRQMCMEHEERAVGEREGKGKGEERKEGKGVGRMSRAYAGIPYGGCRRTPSLLPADALLRSADLFVRNAQLEEEVGTGAGAGGGAGGEAAGGKGGTLAVHWRRGDFGEYCLLYTRNPQACFYSPRQAANCTIRTVRALNLTSIFLATNAPEDEVIAFKRYLRVHSSEYPLPVRQLSGADVDRAFARLHDRLAKLQPGSGASGISGVGWDRELGGASHEVGGTPLHVGTPELPTWQSQRSLVAAELDKLVAAHATVFLGSPESTFSVDITRLRVELGTAHAQDGLVCGGEEEWVSSSSLVGLTPELGAIKRKLWRRSAAKRRAGPRRRASRRSHDLK